MKVVGLYITVLVIVASGLLCVGNAGAQVKNLLVNPYFTEGLAGWTLEQQDPFVKGDMMPDSTTKVIGEYSLKMDIREIQAGAETWRAQPKQTGLTLMAGQKYTWSFWAKAEAERQLQCQVLVDVSDWRLLGLDEPVNIDTEWKEYYKTFTCTEDYGNARITWLCAQTPVDFWLDNVILYEGDYVEGLMANEIEMKPSPVDRQSVLTTTWGKTKSGQ